MLYNIYAICTLRNIQHLQYESLYNFFLNTNKVGIVS